MGAGTSPHGRMKLCAMLQSDGHYADLSGGSKDGVNIAGGCGRSVPAKGLEAAYEGKTRLTSAVAQMLWSYCLLQ